MATSVVKVEGKKFEARQAELSQTVNSIVVNDSASCLAAKTKQREIRDELKMVHAVLDPFVSNAKSAWDQAKDERSRYVDPLEKLDDALALKVKDYERLEREKAEAEQRRINEERRRKAEEEAAAQRKADEERAAAERKAREKEIAEQQKAGELKKKEAEKLRKEAEERERAAREQAAKDAELAKASVKDVEIRPNIPTVAGVPSRRNWKFRILDETRIPRQYLTPNEVKIGAEVRFLKDKAKAEALIPGIQVYED